MTAYPLPEVWLRGPLPGIAPLLQPVAHALLQAQEEVTQLVLHLPQEMLWARPAGIASAGFHLQHLTGVLDRLFTYAAGGSLTEHQLSCLQTEGNDNGKEHTGASLLAHFSRQVSSALEQLSKFDESTFTEARQVGRAGLPSTVAGLLVHAAEHTMRHVGQLLVTVKVLTFHQP